jgi:hypothetical protein
VVGEGWSYELLLGEVSYFGTRPVTRYVVHWGNGEVEEFTTAGVKFHVFADGTAVRDVRVDLYDGQNTYAGAGTVRVTVQDVAPTLTIGGGALVVAGTAYGMTLSVEDPGDDGITGWVIDWGDGSTEPAGGAQSSAQHVYARAGTYTLRATATNEDGTFSSNALTVNVTEPGTTPQTAIDLGLLRPRNRKILRETLTATKRELYYRFSTDAPVRLDATMTGLRGNADLELLDAAGNPLVRSARLARRGERVIRVLPPGGYFIRVSLAAEATTTPFRLNVLAKMPSKRDLSALA